MKRHQIAGVSVLLIGLAIWSPQLVAQTVLPVKPLPDDSGAVPISSRQTFQSPILAYVPPTSKEKLQLFEFDAFGPYAFATAATVGGYQQSSKSPPEWGSGWGAFGDRVASNYGIQLVTTTTRYGLAAILREDAVYYRCECKGFFLRLTHALISTLTARRGQDGHNVFSIPGLVSPYAGTMTSLAWYPRRYSAKDSFRTGNYNLAGQAAGNVALEFIYGGPHTLFSHVGRSKLTGGSGAEPNP